MSAGKDLIAVNRRVTTHVDHTAVLVVRAINSTTMVIHVEVSKFTSRKCRNILTMQTLMNAPEALICAPITAPTLMEATHVLVEQDIAYQLMAVDAMV